MSSVSIPVLKLPNLKELPLPAYATPQSAGLDLLAAVLEDQIVKPSQRILIPTGMAMALPKGFEAQIRPRSGLAIKHGITLINSPGTIDADYRGEIFIPIINLGIEEFTVTRGMKIAQMVVAKYNSANWNIVPKLDDTQRGEGGFGSTGL